MERTISDEEKLRRAIQISKRRNNNNYQVTTERVNDKKEYKLFKKMILQIIICLLIYIIFYLITSTNYVFSTDVIKSTNDILNYDINFLEMYNNLMLLITPEIDNNSSVYQNDINLEKNKIQTNNEQIPQNNVVENSAITEVDNLVETKNIVTEEVNEEEENETTEDNKEENKEEEIAKTQIELDAESAGKVCEFQKPLSGTITSKFGERQATIKGMTTDHKGIDIAANLGTSIKAAMEGTVSVAEENSEYGKFIKIVNEDVMTVYAHCKTLKVKVGDKIKMGQTIATVGSTGNSTGPHLHFEIRFQNRYINPGLLINF